MSNRNVNAFIRWVPAEAGGRREVPDRCVYSTVARFEDDAKWPHEGWSLVVRIARFYRDGRCAYAEVEFLVDDAPVELLSAGSRFELLEGNRRVAKGVVLPTAVHAPENINDFEVALLG